MLYLRMVAVLDTLDALIAEWELWDDLPFDQLKDRGQMLRAHFVTTPWEREQDIPWTIIRTRCSRYWPGYLARGRTKTTRTATILAAYLWRFRVATGRWPERLDDALPENARVDTADPYTGRPFKYSLSAGRPRLYSIGEDGEDNGGVHGEWDQPRTDFVFFSPAVR